MSIARIATVAAAGVWLSACSDGGGSPPPAPPTNAPPSFTSPAVVSAPENTAGVFYTATASDPNGDALSFSIAGGADAGRFTIVAASGALSFLAPPDFEIPADANGDNVYEVTLSVSDGRGGAASLALRVTVIDVAEGFKVRRRAVGLSQPVFVTGAGDGSGRLFVVEKTGRIRILNPNTGAINSAPFLEISATISTTSERGLLGLAFAPDYAASGRFYVYVTNLAGDTEVRRYQRSTIDPNLADFASGDVIMTFAQPASNHNAGWMGFGPDGLLYIASGDGGGNNSTTNPAQNLNSLLGKILRIDVSGDDFPADPARDYRIPAANPFAGGGGAPEILAYGLRNPYRASFDPANGRLIIGDVGEGAREEIDVIPAGTAGQNFGWVRFEGTLVFNAAASAPNALPPVVEYNHGGGPFEGNSVTGGVVNRGPVPALQGQYIFGDFISRNIWSVPAASLTQGTTLSAGALTRQTDAFLPDVGTIDQISSFGVDDAGNVYIVDFGGEVFRLENP